LPVRRPGGRPAAPILDKELSHYEEGLRWSFSGGRVFLEGHDVNALISDENCSVRTWLGLASGLDTYRKKIAAQANQTSQFTKFDAVVEALIGKILGCLKRVYDQKRSGIRWQMENGQLILNGINVRSFLALYRMNRNEKATRYLEGLKEKLEIIVNDPDHGKIRPTALELLEEIKETLGKAPRGTAPRGAPPRPLRPVPAGGGLGS